MLVINILTCVFFFFFSGLAVDTFSRNIYWSDSILDRIEVASIRSPSPNGFEGKHDQDVLNRLARSGHLYFIFNFPFQCFHSDFFNYPFHPLYHKIAWNVIDIRTKQIPYFILTYTHSTDRPVRKVLISNNIHQPQSLALDLDNGYMYWVDMDSSNHRIEQARLDGSERKQLFTGLQLMVCPTTSLNGSLLFVPIATCNNNP